MANKLVQPMKDLGGNYYNNTWPGYKFKEKLGYTTGRHTGVDYNNGGGGNSDYGYGAYAIGTGKVVKVVPTSKSPTGFGNTLIYELTDKALIKRMGLSGKRVYVRYLHLSRFLVKVGQNIRIGQRIAEVGNSGTTWAHLHADMWHSGNGLGAHMSYHKDSQLASYLDIYKTAFKYRAAPPPYTPPPKPAPAPKPVPIEPPAKPKPPTPEYTELKKEIEKVRAETVSAKEAVKKETERGDKLEKNQNIIITLLKSVGAVFASFINKIGGKQ